MSSTLSVTVTYLAMGRPPSPSTSAPDLPAGARLEPMPRPSVRFYRYLYDAVGRDWLWWERRLWSDEALAAHLAHPGVELHLLSLAGEPMGFCEIDSRTAEAPDLTLFGLVPEATGHGLGPAMMGRVLAGLWARPEVARVTLNTCTLDHPKALSFYRAVGFDPVGQEERIIPDPRLRPGWADGPGRLTDASPGA